MQTKKPLPRRKGFLLIVKDITVEEVVADFESVGEMLNGNVAIAPSSGLIASRKAAQMLLMCLREKWKP